MAIVFKAGGAVAGVTADKGLLPVRVNRRNGHPQASGALGFLNIDPGGDFKRAPGARLGVEAARGLRRRLCKINSGKRSSDEGYSRIFQKSSARIGTRGGANGGHTENSGLDKKTGAIGVGQNTPKLAQAAAA